MSVPIALSGWTTRARGTPFVARLTETRDNAEGSEAPQALLINRDAAVRTVDGSGFRAVLWKGSAVDVAGCLGLQLPAELEHLAAGDVVRVSPAGGHIQVIYRKASPFNSLLFTENCNSRCLMCSQPPREEPDDFLVDAILDAIPLMDAETRELGVTGGEPTLHFDRLLAVVESARARLPQTALHVLTNGRLFAYTEYGRRLAAIGHADLMLGIPIYSDQPSVHDFVVQARGAFDQTLRGLLELGRHRVRVEVRVVLHRMTYARLPQLADFLARNLPFVNHVALMGLEVMGYTRMNLDALWVDPVAYQRELAECVHRLDRAGFRVSIYNHQLCTLDRSLWPYARQSISDWKNAYLPSCDSCAVRSTCGGFFASSALRRSAYIRPIESATPR